MCGSGFVGSIGNQRIGDITTPYAARYRAELAPAKAAACWALLRENIDISGCRSVLDIGCGTGDFLDVARYHGLATAGIDIDAPSAAIANARGHRTLTGSAESNVPAHAQRFDLVTMWDVLEHLESPGAALRAAKSALAPGGRLVILSPALGTIFDRTARTLHSATFGRFDILLRMCWTQEHLYRFEGRGVVRWLRDSGWDGASAVPAQLLSLRDEFYAGSSLLPRWTASRLVNRGISRMAVTIARRMRLANKVLIVARVPA